MFQLDVIYLILIYWYQLMQEEYASKIIILEVLPNISLITNLIKIIKVKNVLFIIRFVICDLCGLSVICL